MFIYLYLLVLVLFTMGTIGQLLSTLDADQRKTFRDYERNERKIVRQKNSHVFNDTCLKEGLLPKYANKVDCIQRAQIF